MAGLSAYTLPKAERISGRESVSALVDKGHHLVQGCLKCRFLSDNGLGYSRIMVSVPKRNFKRAVKRNLIRRRIRESYRLNKQALGPGFDVLFYYAEKEVLTFEAICADMVEALKSISGGK